MERKEKVSTSPESSDKLEVKPELQGLTLAEQQRDLQDYFKRLNSLSEHEKNNFLNASLQMDRFSLRNAGLSIQENLQDPQKRFSLLSRAYLEKRVTVRGMGFLVDFHGNTEAENSIGLGDMLPPGPPGIEAVDIYDEAGKLIYANAVRMTVNGRDGYYVLEEQDSPENALPTLREKEYLPVYASIHSGYTAIVKLTKAAEKMPTQQELQKQLEAGINFTRNHQKRVLAEAIKTAGTKNGLKFTFDQDFYDFTLERILQGKFAELIIPPETWQVRDEKGMVKTFQVEQVFDSTMMNQWAEKFVQLYQKAQQEKERPATQNSAVNPRRKVSVAGVPQKPVTQRRGDIQELVKNYDAFESGQYEKITRDWLFQNVAKTPEQVEPFLVKSFKFMGAEIPRVNKIIIPYLIEAQERMHEAGVNYQLRQHACSCQNWRKIRNGNSQSMHSWATAIDLNTDYHRFGSTRTDMPEDFVQIMEEVGFRWGGRWKGERADPMHFELAINPYTSTMLLKSARAQEAAREFLS